MGNPAWSSSLTLVVAAAAVMASLHESMAAGNGGRGLNQYDERFALASLRDEEGKHLCSGIPVARDAILTAARCFNSRDTGATHQVHLKILTKEGWDHSSVEILSSRQIILHPNYNAASSDNDVAVVFLNGKTSVLTYPLEGTDECFESEAGCAARLLDWGDSTSVISLGGVPRERCRQLLPFTITENMICAENLQPAICASDHGAPLLVGGKLVGIASTSFGCGRPGNPEVYTSIPAVKWWIEEQLAGQWNGDTQESTEWAQEAEETSESKEPVSVVEPGEASAQPPVAPEPTSPPPPPPPPPTPAPAPAPSPPPSPSQITASLRQAIFSGDVNGAADILSTNSDVGALAAGFSVSGRRRLFGF